MGGGGVFLGLFGLMILFYAIRAMGEQMEQDEALSAAQPAQAGALPEREMVILTGHAERIRSEGGEQVLIAPMTGRACLYWELSIVEIYPGPRRGSSSRTLFKRNTGTTACSLRDATGEVWLLLHQAREIKLPELETGRYSELPEDRRLAIAQAGWKFSKKGGYKEEQVEVWENILPVGERVRAVGLATSSQDEPALGAGLDDQPLIVAAGHLADDPLPGYTGGLGCHFWMIGLGLVITIIGCFGAQILEALTP